RRNRPARPIPGAWFEIWTRRRDAREPFDEFFFCGPADQIRPASLSAGLIERGARDPAELWFGAVLGARPVDWRPLTRSRGKSLGLLAHRIVAATLRATAGEIFGRLPRIKEAREQLNRALTELHTRWPQDCYWNSFHAELTQKTEALLEQVFQLRREGFVAAELPLRDVAVPLGGSASIAVRGRIDLVLLDQPDWSGAQADIIDFKTGGDEKLSVKRMAEHGDSLQLGIYLAAAASLGLADGRIWMLKPDEPPSSLSLEELPGALKKLDQLGRHLATGRYGALTPDRTGFIEGCPWPLACAPIAHETLVAKFAVTFPLGGAA
ncbi:MAG: PD-(D/E)XK nuclease family protein, partial [Verrucomicrobiota bacterium]|nr:PD-(D/E)XK nuclease family protein [Verrucomicrobiota bacterium]